VFPTRHPACVHAPRREKRSCARSPELENAIKLVLATWAVALVVAGCEINDGHPPHVAVVDGTITSTDVRDFWRHVND